MECFKTKTKRITYKLKLKPNELSDYSRHSIENIISTTR